MRVTPASEVLAALRAATAERHRIVERSMPLSRPEPTHADYLDHLRLMRAWLYPLECWLEGSPIFDTALIDADLAGAGVQPEHEPADAVMVRWPSTAGTPYRWGARYVIEGSRLGAAALYRRLRQALRPHELWYLHGGSESSVDRWANFLRELRAAVSHPVEIAAACEGACDSFDALLALSSRWQLRSQSAGERI